MAMNYDIFIVLLQVGRDQMRGGAGGEGDPIMAGVRRAGLPLKMDTRTVGDGNCFPRAVTQQCQRAAMAINTVRDHKDLRKKLCKFMVETELQVVQVMKRLWEVSGGVEEPWEAYWQRMSGDKVWVESMFIQGMAWYLERDIHLIMDCATPANPWMEPISGNRDGSGSACPGGFLILGYHRGLHYQSLLPLDEQTFRPGALQPMTLEEIMKRAQCRENKADKVNKDPAEDFEEELLSVREFDIGGEVLVRATETETGNHEFTCLICNTTQKQVASHMKKDHGEKFSPEVLKVFQAEWSRFANRLAQNRQRHKKRRTNHEGLKEENREAKAKHRGKRKNEDHEGLKEENREAVAKQSSKNRNEDHEENDHQHQ